MAMKYTIKTVAQLTGLSAHTIRAWERRHGLLSPSRTDTNRRLYEDSDVEQLKLLRQAVESGHAIGQVAQLSLEDLRRLSASPLATGVSGSSAGALLAACEQAMDRLSADGLEQALVRAGATLGLTGLLEGVVVPLVERISVR